MEKIIRISVQDLTVFARLNESETAHAIWEALPLQGKANRWGEEIYFAIPLDLPEAADARQEMDIGELGYWPTGNAFCVFFGPTPVSEGDKPRAYSNVNPFGRVQGDPKMFLKVKDGDPVRVEQAPGS